MKKKTMEIFILSERSIEAGWENAQKKKADGARGEMLDL